MTTIELTSVAGLTYPYTVYVCNVYGLECVLVAVINSSVPPTNTIILPYPFDTAPAVGIKIITSDGCVRFKIIYCSDNHKQFMNIEDFNFMDGDFYDFQYQ